MKILFTLLSIDCGDTIYLQSAKRLVKEVLSQTNHDVLLSTNNINFFEDLESERFILRNNIEESSVFKYDTEFNYNLKHHAFKDIPTEYDILIYLDCDIKLNKWTENSENYLKNIFLENDFGANRLNCVLSDEIGSYINNKNCLFTHKILSYRILEKYLSSDDIMNSKLPSEHFLIFKNDEKKIKSFAKKWKELNDYLQGINGLNGSWGDGFEIGISARFAGFHKTIEVSHGAWSEVLGFEFNGNKYYDTVTDNSNKNFKNLTLLANSFGSDKGTEHFESHSYTEIYQEYLSPYSDKKIKMLEIGVNDERFPGASIKMWTSFFDDLEFIGFDINQKTKEFEKNNVKIFIGDQGNTSDLQKLVGELGGNFDIIIDDGSHQHLHHILSFTNLEPHLNQGGIYIIEDLHAYDGELTKHWFSINKKNHNLFCDGKLLIYKK